MLFKKNILGLFIFFYLGYFCLPVFADTLILKSGQVIEGKIIENTDKYVKIDFDGVELIYFQDEVASINQGKNDNVNSQELTSLYEAFKSSKNVVGDKKVLTESIEPMQTIVNQEVRDNAETNVISLPQTVEGLNSPETVQAALSKLPKEYQEMINLRLQNMQSSNGQSQVPAAANIDLSKLPLEYQNVIKSSLEKSTPNTEAVKN